MRAALWAVSPYWHPIRNAVLTYVATIAGTTALAWYIFRRRDILT